eukprot:Plantae.Rhodophyta-Purpureofilum_apyrenoidigerum.ctg3132.p1 GENE.Plantae.Rhodophyta-Purpureofilum_apyrenoidigerum.ctg3132~~Plantae.Rhodophyta-Purpureofilum_apyrenoidigerum.ctg3132.p1  ORF type:complete len:555 (+),score=62.75 Plantae.Rhodophyta-Purpureofilum_apyrenoidigerum.ctg3132:1432-3096(+)
MFCGSGCCGCTRCLLFNEVDMAPHTRLATVLCVVFVDIALLFAGSVTACANIQGAAQKIVPESTPERAFFGSYVQMSEDTMVVSGYGEDGFSGGVRVYNLVQGTWQFLQALKWSAPRNGDHFGWEAAVNGNRIIVGAAYSTTDGVKSGKGFIFERPSRADLFREVAVLQSPEQADGNNFGYSVYLDETDVLVGAEQGLTSKTAEFAAGAVHVYRDTNSSWTLVQTLRGETFHAEFGDDIKRGGEYMLVGAPRAVVSGTNLTCGGAYIFKRDDAGEWTQLQKLSPDGPCERSDHFGTSGAIDPDGTTIVVGADRGPGPVSTSQGAVYIYQLQDGVFQFVQSLSPTDGRYNDRFGYRMAVVGDLMLVSAWATDDVAEDSGSYYVLRRTSSKWFISEKEINPVSSPDSRYGLVLAMNQDWMVVTNSREDNDTLTNSREDTRQDSGAIYLHRVYRTPISSIYFLPAPFLMPRSGAFPVNVGLCTRDSKDVEIQGVITRRSDNSRVAYTKVFAEAGQNNATLQFQLPMLSYGAYIVGLSLRDPLSQAILKTSSAVSTVA